MERYVLNTDSETMENTFGVFEGTESALEPTFNAAPGHSLPILYSDRGVISLQTATWGFKKGKESISALSAEEVLSDAELSGMLKTNACIIPVTGFYKWKQTVSDPLPFFLRIHTRDILGVAGFYIENGNKRDSFCVLTTEANVLIKPLDDTMPCILSPMNFEKWLNGDAVRLLNAGFNDTSLLPEMTVFRVPDLVNDPSLNSPELMQPIPKLRDED